MATKDVLGQVRQNAGNTQKSSQWYVNQVRKLVGGTYQHLDFKMITSET